MHAHTERHNKEGTEASVQNPDKLQIIYRQEKKGMTQDEMFGWHHQLNGHEFE